MTIVQQLPYGPFVDGPKFRMNFSNHAWHTFGDEHCDECDATVIHDYPVRHVCGKLLHHQIQGPYMGDQANGCEEDWMCEECGDVDGDEWEQQTEE